VEKEHSIIAYIKSTPTKSIAWRRKGMSKTGQMFLEQQENIGNALTECLEIATNYEITFDKIIEAYRKIYG
jgi:hypothetical protein